MDGNVPEPRFVVGDLVRCWYTLYQHYYYHLNNWEDDEQPVYGVIIDIEYAQYDDGWDYDVIYVVYCLDGVYRFFVEEELWKIA